MVEQVIEKAWKELKNKEVKSKNIRVEKPQLKSVTARLNHCTLSDRKRKKDWQVMESPCKLAKGGQHSPIFWLIWVVK